MVLLDHVPLAAVAALTAMAAVASDPPPSRHAHIDFVGAALLGVAIIALIVGLAQSQSWGWDSPLVWALLGVAVAAAEAQAFDPLLSPYLHAAGVAAAWGYAAAFVGVTIIGIAGLFLALRGRVSPSRPSSTPDA